MKGSKKLLSVLCALASISLVACNGTENGDSSSSNTDSSSSISSSVPSSSDSSDDDSSSSLPATDYSISQITEAGKSYTVRGVVAAKNTEGVTLADETGAIQIYGYNFVDYDIGTYLEVTGVVDQSGPGHDHGLLQFSYSDGVTATVLDGEDAPSLAAAENLTAEIANSWATDAYSVTANKLYTWETTIGKEGTYFTANIEGSETLIEPSYVPDNFEIKENYTYTISAYFLGYDTKYGYASVMITEVTPIQISATNVQFTNTDTDLLVGESVELTTDLTPADTTDAVTYAITEGSDFATLEGNKLTAVAAGSVTVTATAGTVSDTITFTITEPEDVSVSFSQDSLEVETGTTYDLNFLVKVIGTDNTGLTWTSSDDEIATVDNGVVTGVKAGDVTITATSVEDSTKSDTIAIKIYDHDYSIGQIGEGSDGKEYKVRGVVDAMTTKGLVITDGQASIYVFLGDPSGYAIDDVVEVSGIISSFNGLYQFGNDAEVTKIEDIEFTPAAPTPLTAEIADSWATAESFTTEDMKEYTWTATAGKAGSYYTFNIAGSNTVIEPSYVPDNFEIKENYTYTITAYFGGYSSYSSYAAVYLTQLEEISAPTLTGIKVTAAGDTTIKTGTTLQLNAAAIPTGAAIDGLTWESSNTDVATVDGNGLVTAVAAGSATITAKVGEISGTIDVTVSDEIVENQKLVADYYTGWEDYVLSGNDFGSAFDVSTLNSGGVDIATEVISSSKLNSSSKHGGIKFGTGSDGGSLSFKATVSVKKITIKAIAWKGGKVSMTVANGTIVGDTGDTFALQGTDGQTIEECSWSFAEATDTIEISTTSRLAIVGITLEY